MFDIEIYESAPDIHALTKKVILMSIALDRLTASVAANASATASVLALLATVSAEIRAGLIADDSAALNALADKLDAEGNTIAAAITANTPAEGDASTTPGGDGADDANDASEAPTPVSDVPSGNADAGGGTPSDAEEASTPSSADEETALASASEGTSPPA